MTLMATSPWWTVVLIGKKMHRVKKLMATWCGREIKGDRVLKVGLGSCKTCRRLSSEKGSVKE